LGRQVFFCSEIVPQYQHANENENDCEHQRQSYSSTTLQATFATHHPALHFATLATAGCAREGMQLTHPSSSHSGSLKRSIVARE
jgi:hypothetical protein